MSQQKRTILKCSAHHFYGVKTLTECHERYGSFDFTQAGHGSGRWFGEKFLEPPSGKHWIWGQEKINEGMQLGQIIFTKNGTPRVKRYHDEKKGNYLGDLWTDRVI